MGPRRRDCAQGAVAGAVIGLALAPVQPEAGPWTQDQGDALQILTFVYDSANAAFEARNGQRAETDFTKYEIDLYSEFGVTDRFTLVLHAPYQHIRDEAGDEPVEISGAGDLELAVRAKLFERDGFIASLQPMVGFPGEATGGGQAPLEAAGRFYEVRALFGRGGTLVGRPSFWAAEGGYRVRTGAAPDEWRADVTFGLSPNGRWQVLAQNFNTISSGAARAPFAPFRSHKVQVSGVRQVTDTVSIQLGGFHTFAGENVIAEVGGFTAVWIDWDRAQ
ncbi:MAG: hypothetical protein AAGL49_01615 [Pseudomonadota bacterium]